MVVYEFFVFDTHNTHKNVYTDAGIFTLIVILKGYYTGTVRI